MMKNDKAKTLLIVDDDQVLLRMLESRLRAEGYHVRSTYEAAVGLQMVMDTPPDLIVLDVMMPIINGYNFCRLLKKECGERVKGIPVVFLTSRDDPEDKQIGMEMGADRYLTKPLNMEDLLKVIEDLLRRD